MTATNSHPPGSPWKDPEKVEALRRLYGSGCTYTEIAKTLKVSREAIGGAVHRLGLSREKPKPLVKPKPHQAPFPPRRAFTPAAKANATGGATAQVPKLKSVPLPKAKPETRPIELRKPLLELGYDECHFPIGDPREPGYAFCAAPTQNSKVYCPEHYARSYTRSAP
jgi:GcrA cell cycle regulator